MAIDGSRSKFPQNVDSFLELYDLPHDKVKQANRLVELKGQANLTNDEQNELLQLTTSLKEFMITAETFNQFQDSLFAVQRFFNSEVNVYIQDKQNLWDTYVSSFKYVGKWTTGTSYKFQNMVTDDAGDLFICKKDCVASTTTKTTNTTYWQRASAKGEKGDTGLNAILKGNWSSSVAYVVGDAVRYQDVFYVAISNNTNSIPSASSTNWTLYDKLYVGSTRPTATGAGLHFVKVTKEF